jgi:hypothetical protein
MATPSSVSAQQVKKGVVMPHFRPGSHYARWRDDGVWYRCRLLNPPASGEADEVTVLFTDYGNQGVVSWRTELCHIATDIPEQDYKDAFVLEASLGHRLRLTIYA